MGLLEYLEMNSLREYIYNKYSITAPVNPLARSWAVPGEQSYCTEKAGGTARPSHTKSHLQGPSPPASQAGRRVGPAL
jgi:hypothetical protein